MTRATRSMLVGLLLSVAMAMAQAARADHPASRDAVADGAATDEPAEEASAEEPAGVLVRVAFRDNFLSLDQYDFEAMLSDAAAAALAPTTRPARPATAPAWRADVEVRGFGAPTSEAVVRPVRADPAAAPEPVGEATVRMGAALPGQVERAWRDRWEGKIAEREQRVAEARAEQKRRSAELDAVRDELRALTGRLDVSRDVLLKEATTLDDEVQRLELDLAAKQVRQEAMAEEIAAVSKAAEGDAADDPIAAELAKVVAALAERHERTKQLADQGQAAKAEVSETAAAVAEARARLLERRREAAAEAGGSALGEWNKELRSLSIDVRELRARTELLAARRAGLKAALPLLDRFRTIERDVARAMQEAERAEQALREANEGYRAAEPPVVTVSGVPLKHPHLGARHPRNLRQ